MIINKISDKNNSKLIAEKYHEWINLGVSSDEILVLTFNSTSKKNIIKNILNLIKNKTLSDIKIYTFGGLIYNSVADNWGILENKIVDNNTSILPSLNGMEISQYILKQIIKDEEVKGYNSKKSLLHQIFRRYSLIVNNNLSIAEINKKSEILSEAFCNDAEKIIHNYKSKTLALRAFDNIRQTQIFSYIYKNTSYFSKIKYLIVEDGDEFPPIITDFIKTISSQIKDKLILFDKLGGSRRGFLCADVNICSELENIFNETAVDYSKQLPNITKMQENILENTRNKIDNLLVFSFSKRVEMAEKAVDLINNLIKSGCKPADISVITPIQDNLLRYSLNSGLKNCYPIFLSGNEKLSNNPLVKTVLSILKLSYNIPLDEFDLRTIITNYLQIPIKYSKKIIEIYKLKQTIIPVDLAEPIYAENLNYFCNILQKLKLSDMTLSQKCYFIYINYKHPTDKYTLNKFNFFLKELQDFEKIFDSNQISPKDIIIQIENSIISENPYSILEKQENELIIATPQKIIDNKIKTKYQFWIDTSSSEWIKADIGPLYNSWVFQKSWNKSEYTIEDNINLSKEKTFRVLRKLMLNTDKIYAFASLFDTQGIENQGGIEQFLISSTIDLKSEINPKKFIITPRDDQKPILEYKKGYMAISAVPGAGKTTILLALIIKLLRKNIDPDNIYVLTYMESAARNFKDKIKTVYENSNKLPNISTIHGLALKILKENSNHERLGLNSDFEICDDTQRGSILRTLKKDLSKNEFDEFERGISILKLSGANINPEFNQDIFRILNLKKGNKSDLKLSKFLKFFYNYKQILRQNNLIDYDDILLYAVQLLENNEDILKYYQEICKYIIEDEAQDSSAIQQRLINLLSAKHKNLIRCGDINQAITTTFTNADVDGFRNFIETSSCINMNCSQRCSEGVWKLANTLVKYGNSHAGAPFYEIYMNPVDGKNPIEKKPICTKIFNTPLEEKIEIIKTIKFILSSNQKATIGILLRNNYQVNQWADYLNNSGLCAITRNECLGQKKIFKVILSIFKFISNPYDNTLAANAYKTLAECGIFKLHLDKIIENMNNSNNKSDFITLDNDKISDSELARFHWDMNYWLSFPELSIDELAIRIGMHYFSENIEKSNIYLISTLCSKLNTGNFSQTVQRLDELSRRPNLNGFKFFSEEEDDKHEGKILVMTLHKSKGDEFDYVFLPEMSENNLTLDINELNLKKSSLFEEQIRNLNKNYNQKSEVQIKQSLLNENYRLLYVAITRAKKRLYISASKKEQYFNKLKISKPSIIFKEIFNIAHKVSD